MKNKESKAEYRKGIQTRKKNVIAMVEKTLPQLMQVVAYAENNPTEDGLKPPIALHQDAFAADYQYEELVLLGAAIKYLGMKGIEVHIMGTNEETIERQ